MGIRMLGLGALLIVSTVALAGCSQGPSRDDVVERFAIELAAGAGEPEDWTELAEGLADDAFAGHCGEDGYRLGLGDDPALRYAWAAGCTMHFEGDFTPAQYEQAKQDIVDYTISTLDE